MGSTRLPGKVLERLYKNDLVLDVMIKRLKYSKNIDEIIIATTSNKKDKVFLKIANKHKISYFEGSEKNVLSRYYNASKKYKLDIIIRVTSDCPFVDPKILDDMIEFYKSQNYHYIRNIDSKTNFPRGTDIEIFDSDVLEKVFNNAETKQEKEHVTYYIYSHPELFDIYSYNLENIKEHVYPGCEYILLEPEEN